MHDSAVYYLQKILIEEPNHTLAAVELGYAYYSLSRCREAVAALKPALLAKPKPEIAVYYTGMCMVKIGNKELALDKYNELVILNSAYAAKLLQEIQKLH